MATQAQAAPLVDAKQQDEFQTGQVLTIVGGHFTHDTFSAFLSPLLPLIIERLSLSLAMAGSLWGLTQIPALIYPLIGYMADRLSLRYFVIFAPAVTATMMSLLGIVPSFMGLAVLLLVVGVSTAAFHAPAPAMIARLSGDRLGKGMSLFMAGGELGRTVGPLLAVWAVSALTMDGFYQLMVLGWAASAVLYWRLRDIPARTDRQQSWGEMWPVARRLFAPLLAVMAPREFMLTSLAVYLPTFMNLEGSSLWIAGASLSIWELAGIGGALTSGTLSDKLGRKKVLLVMILASSLLMLAFLGSSGWLIVPVLLALGFTSLSATPVMLAMVQEHLPHNRALANSLFLTMSFLLRPAAAFIIGLVGDHYGLRTAFLWAAFASFASVPMVYFLPYLKNESTDQRISE